MIVSRVVGNNSYDMPLKWGQAKHHLRGVWWWKTGHRRRGFKNKQTVLLSRVLNYRECVKPATAMLSLCIGQQGRVIASLAYLPLLHRPPTWQHCCGDPYTRTATANATTYPSGSRLFNLFVTCCLCIDMTTGNPQYLSEKRKSSGWCPLAPPDKVHQHGQNKSYNSDDFQLHNLTEWLKFFM